MLSFTKSRLFFVFVIALNLIQPSWASSCSELSQILRTEEDSELGGLLTDLEMREAELREKFGDRRELRISRVYLDVIERLFEKAEPLTPGALKVIRIGMAPLKDRIKLTFDSYRSLDLRANGKTPFEGRGSTMIAYSIPFKDEAEARRILPQLNDEAVSRLRAEYYWDLVGHSQSLTDQKTKKVYTTTGIGPRLENSTWIRILPSFIARARWKISGNPELTKIREDLKEVLRWTLNFYDYLQNEWTEHPPLPESQIPGMRNW